MINREDEKMLRKIVHEMNIGFVAPQNGGIPSQSVVVMKQGKGPTDFAKDEDAPQDVQQAVTAVIEDLNHIKMDLDQGCQGDAQIQQLQACCEKLTEVINNIGNNPSQNSQSSAFTGMGENGNNGEAGGEASNTLSNL